MSFFSRAINYVLRNEGKYVNNKKDPGGETKFGISSRAYPDVDLKTLTMERAIDIYHKNYWRPYMDRITDYRVAAKVFDMGVNMGLYQAAKILQRAAGVEHVDGVVGPKTIEIVNKHNPDLLLQKIVTELTAFYRHIAADSPRRATFLKGWLNRAKRLPKMED